MKTFDKVIQLLIEKACSGEVKARDRDTWIISIKVTPWKVRRLIRRLDELGYESWWREGSIHVSFYGDKYWESLDYWDNPYCEKGVIKW